MLFKFDREKYCERKKKYEYPSTIYVRDLNFNTINK